MDTSSGDQELLAEQIDCDRAVAGEYFDGQPDEGGGDELVTVINEFAPTGDVLELACGPGTWTPQLLRRADSVTAVDASPEMQVLANSDSKSTSSGCEAGSALRRCLQLTDRARTVHEQLEDGPASGITECLERPPSGTLVSEHEP